MKVYLGIEAKNLLLDEKNPFFKKLKIGLSKKNYQHRWIPTDSQTITLVGSSIIDQDLSLLDHHLRDLTFFPVTQLHLQGIWAYPNQSSARVLWVGVQNSKKLKELHQEALHKFTMCGFKIDSELMTPYLPFLRFRNHRDVTDLISPYKNFDFGFLKVERLSLYQMVTGGAFPTFKTLKIYHLHEEMKQVEL